MHIIHRDDLWIQNKLGIKLSKTEFWVAGGAALSWFLGRPTNGDIDLYFPSEQKFNAFKRALEAKLRGVEKSISEISDYLIPPHDYPHTIHETQNAISYDINDGVTMNHLGKLQLIRRNFYNNPQECVEDFDISICQIATDGDKIWVGEHTLEDIEKRQFRFTKNIGVSSARRFIKYHAYGFRAVDEAYDQLFAADNVSWVRAVGQDDYA